MLLIHFVAFKIFFPTLAKPQLESDVENKSYSTSYVEIKAKCKRNVPEATYSSRFLFTGLLGF